MITRGARLMVHGPDTGKSVILSIVTIIRVRSGGSSRDFREKHGGLGWQWYMVGILLKLGWRVLWVAPQAVG